MDARDRDADSFPASSDRAELADMDDDELAADAWDADTTAAGGCGWAGVADTEPTAGDDAADMLLHYLLSRSCTLIYPSARQARVIQISKCHSAKVSARRGGEGNSGKVDVRSRGQDEEISLAHSKQFNKP